MVCTEDRHGLKSSTSAQINTAFPRLTTNNNNNNLQLQPQLAFSHLTFALEFLDFRERRRFYEKEKRGRNSKDASHVLYETIAGSYCKPLPFPRLPGAYQRIARSQPGQKLMVYRPRSFRIPLHHHRARSLDGCLERVVSVSAFSISPMTWPSTHHHFPLHRRMNREDSDVLECSGKQEQFMRSGVVVQWSVACYCASAYKRRSSAAAPTCI